MNNEQILLENRLLGSDSTEHDTETKYVFMQKYYHKGAFYQDSSDPIFQRDYNLPTPMEMQDKSALPEVLQKRKGNFGKRGQSKYTHLTAEDTTDTNPLTRADESLLNSWKKKMAGYKK
jgi:microfibrillar-associated protein 1